MEKEKKLTYKSRWSTAEETTLVQAVLERESRLFGSMVGCGSTKHRLAKEAAWEEVANLLNTQFFAEKRDAKSAKRKYYNLKGKGHQSYNLNFRSLQANSRKEDCTFDVMIRFPLSAKPRKLKGVLIGPGSGPAERIKYLQKVVTQLIRHERIEGREDKMDEARGYAEQLLNLAIQNGDRHKPTMEMADKWLLEKDLVHKLFKVLAPRYSNYSEAYTSIYRLPAKYPGNGRFQAVLELKGNPYPPVIPKPYNKESFIVNVLIQSAKNNQKKQRARAELEDKIFRRTAESETVDNNIADEQTNEQTEEVDTKSYKPKDIVGSR